jgi:N-acetylmuramoyl-L-alanine amidase
MRRRPRTLGLLAVVAIPAALAPILAATALASEPTVTVQPGDTLSGIAVEHGVRVEELTAFNALPDPDRIFVGQQLRLVAADPPAAADPAAVSTAGTHVVARGENLTRIARRYGTTVAAIVAANGIANPSRIFAGQQLSIPGAAAVDVPAPNASAPTAVAAPAIAPAATHTVAAGENLTRIAGRYGTTVAAIVAANGIANPSRIFAGQQLAIPGAPVAAAPAVPAGREEVRTMIVEDAALFGVPPALALAVAWHESGWRQAAVSSAGAIGIMQLMPTTADWVGEAMLGEAVHIHDARSNVRAGVRLLAHYLARYAGDRELVLAAYYQGQTAADRFGAYSSSRPYIASILALEAAFAD